MNIIKPGLLFITLALLLTACISDEEKADLSDAVVCGTTCALMGEQMTFTPDPAHGDGDANDAKKRWVKMCAVQCVLDGIMEEE